MLREAVASVLSTTDIGGYGSPLSRGRQKVPSMSAEEDLVTPLLAARRLARSRPLGCVSLAGCGRLLCGARSRRGRPSCRCLAAARPADPAAALRGHVGVGNAATRAALVAAAGLLVDGRPCAPLGFLLADAAMLVSFLDVFGLAFLLVGVAGFIAARHGRLPHRLRVAKPRNAQQCAGFRQTSCRKTRRVNRRLGSLAQASEEGIDAFEQRGGLLAQLARGDEDVVGQPAGLVGGLACAWDVGRDFAGAGGGLLHASRDLAGRRILLLDGGGDGGGDPADLPDGVADAADRDHAIAGGGLDRGDLSGDFLS